MPIRLSSDRSRPIAAVALASASLVGGAGLGSIFLSTARDAWTAVAAPGPAGPADGILLTAGLVGTLLSLWLGLGLTLSALSALPGALGHGSRRLADRVAPAAVRKVVAFVLGTTLTAALVPGTALAGSSGTVHEALRADVVAAGTAPGSDRSSAAGLADAATDPSFRFVSARPPVSDRNDLRDAAPPPAWSFDRTGHTTDHVVVLRGDTLWSVAASHLGPGAEAAEIDREWRRWFSVNRDVIGDDANRILPGQLLRPPTSPPAGS